MVYIMQEKCFPRHGGEAFPFGGKNLRSGRKCPIQYRSTILHQERLTVNDRVKKKYRKKLIHTHIIMLFLGEHLVNIWCTNVHQIGRDRQRRRKDDPQKVPKYGRL